MSKVFVSLVSMSGKVLGAKEPVAIPDSEVYGKQLVESTGASVPSTLVANSALASSDELVWLVRGVSGNSWLKFGATPVGGVGAEPVAAVGDDWFIMEGDLIPISAKKGQKFAVIQG